jgi:circadian clock protein KaiC
MGEEAVPPVRVSSGVAGLDTVLRGGFFQGGVYLIMGPPGTGKTILGNQMCFHHVATGGRALYVTLLAETHARMLTHLRSLTFFDPAPIGEALYYISAYRVSEPDALSALLDLLRQTMRAQRPTLLVLDGFVTAQQAAASELSVKEFIHKLHIFAEAVGCTTLLLTHVRGDGSLSQPEHTMVDGLLELSDQPARMRTVRELEVRKFRGSGYLRGRHSYEITDAGMVVHPRTEALLATPPPDVIPAARVQFGVAELDAMFQGGLPAGSTTMLFGVPGSGKTVLGLHLLAAGAAVGEPGLYFGFNETVPRLLSKADTVGLGLSRMVEQGLIEALWQPPVEGDIDALAERLLEAVHRRQVRRLFIDGLSGFQEATEYPERLGRFFTALMNELRCQGVTTTYSVELRSIVGPTVEMPLQGLAAVTENIIFMRYVELRSQLHRLISILKVRESAFDAAIREFRITAQGIEVATSFASAEAVLTGVARPVMPPGAPPASPPGPP